MIGTAIWISLSLVGILTGLPRGSLTASSPASSSSLPTASGADESTFDDLIASFLGEPFVVDVPVELSEDLPLPPGFGHLQADADTIRSIQLGLGTEAVPVVAYFDRFGNRIVLDVDERCRSGSRVQGAYREYQRRVSALQKQLGSLDSSRAEAEKRERVGKELQLIEQILELGVDGYPEVVTARRRRAAMVRDGRQAFLELMAQEGRMPRREFAKELDRMRDRTEGLPVNKEVRRLLDLIRRNIGVPR